MIGVHAGPSHHPLVREFFELFKTPWEFVRVDGSYDVLFCSEPELPGVSARLCLLFGSQISEFDSGHRISTKGTRIAPVLLHGGVRIPLIGTCATFGLADPRTCMVEEGTGVALAVEWWSQGTKFVRIGYDLLDEVRGMLTAGQPGKDAGVATLERHIGLLRKLIVRAGLPLLEIPPMPSGHPFSVCLTHDVDHPVLKNHQLDHTALGFLFRATLGALLKFGCGRMNFSQLAHNFRAALSLPFVYLGLARDSWLEFDRYLEMEGTAKSTFFVIPRKDCPGRTAIGLAPSKRAARYALADIQKQIARIVASGSEVGVHGIDAWISSTQGRAEAGRVSEASGREATGVRMHWLYFDEESPRRLDAAGFLYDSSFGYNDTIGFRAGTAQVFRPLNATQLLEVPLQVMDTALFYPSHLNLSEPEARKRVLNIADEVSVSGGVFTVNWHDRSIAPERLWDGFYIWLLDVLKARGAWFATVSEAVGWFQKRRSVSFNHVSFAEGVLRTQVSSSTDYGRLPGLRLRVHGLGIRKPSQPGSEPEGEFVDFDFDGSIDQSIHWVEPALSGAQPEIEAHSI